MEACKEMKKLREWLDKEGISWQDRSEEENIRDDSQWYIHRTRCFINNRVLSVINGFGTYGGKQYGGQNLGLLECMWMDEGNPQGFLSHREVIKIIKRESDGKKNKQTKKDRAKQKTRSI